MTFSITCVCVPSTFPISLLPSITHEIHPELEEYYVRECEVSKDENVGKKKEGLEANLKNASSQSSQYANRKDGPKSFSTFSLNVYAKNKK